MNGIYVILLIIGIVLISRNEKLRVRFWTWFVGLIIGLYLFYFFLDSANFLTVENLIGLPILAFILAMFFAFIGKWISEWKFPRTDNVTLRYDEGMGKKIIVAVLVLIGVSALIYFEYARITCNEKARIFANKGQLTVSAMKTAYDGQYQICIRGKGF